MKKIYSFFVALVVIVIGAMMPAKAAVVQDVVDGIHYEFDDYSYTAGVLALPGGEKYTGDVEITETVEYKGDTYSVVRIEDNAFMDCAELTSVTIPSTIYRIGQSAFLRCEALTSIEVPSSVNTMGDGVFMGCSGLTSVTFDAGVANIPESTFNGCKALTSFVVPDGVIEIRDDAFSNCSALETIELPNSLYQIGESAFVLCSRLSSIELPSALSTIGKYAFSLCTSLPTITIPASVTTIGESAFEQCSSLTSIEVEDTNANYCSKDGVLYSKDETTLVAVPGGKEGVFAIPEGVTAVSKSAVSYCTKLTHLSIPQSMATIEEYAFYGCENIKNIVCFAIYPPSVKGSNAFTYIDRDETLLLVPTGSESSYTSDAYWNWFHKTDNTIPDILIDGINYELNILSSGRATVKALPGTDKYEGDIVIPDYVQFCGVKFTVVEIDGYAFENCDVTSVRMPEYIETVGNMAFKGCSHLTSIDLKYISSLGEGAFEGCTGLKSVDIPWITMLNAHTFKDCTGLQSVVIPNLSYIDDEAFAGCTGLEMIICRAPGVVPLGTDVFTDVNGDIPVYITDCNPADYEADPQWSSYFHNFYENYFEQVVDGINYRFNTNPNIASVIPLPGTDKYEGDIVIPAKVQVSGLDFKLHALSSEAFANCIDLTSVSLPESLEAIHDNVFRGCINLTEIILPSTATIVDGQQFDGCTSLHKVILPETMTFIPDFMFSNCTSLDLLIIPAGVTNIGNSAFAGCTGMTFLYCKPVFPPKWDTEYCFENVPNDILVRVPDASLGDYSADPNTPGWSYFTNYIGTEVSVKVNGINYTVNLDSYEAAVKALPGIDKYKGTVIVPDHVSFRDKDYTVTGIGVAAFKNCADLDSIVLPATIEYIDDEAFYGCSGLEVFICLAVTPPTVGTNAFEGILSTYTEGFVPDIHDYYAVPGWETLNLSKYMDKVIDGINYRLQFKDYSASVYSHDDETKYTGDIVIPASVSVLTIPFDVKKIEHSAFSRDYNSSDENLTSVTMPEGLEHIGPYAFFGCGGITAVTIPSTVTAIDEGAFMNTGIAEVTVPTAVTTLGQGVFSRCDNLTAINVEEANADYCSVDGVLFTKDMKTLMAFPKHRPASVENYVYTVPEGVETLAFSAFDECQDMAHLVLPASLTNVEDYAFRSALVDTLTCKAVTPPTATGSAFFWFNRNYCPLFVLFESIDAYNNAPEWKEFSTILSRELFVEVQEATNIHATSADMSWKGSGDSYDLRYKDYYSTDDEWNVVEGITGKSYHMTELKDNTFYVVQVRSKYKDTYGEWFGYGSWNFQTSELFTLTYEVDGEVYATEYHEEGDAIVLLPEPPAKEGYTFSGWQDPVDEMPNYDYTIFGYFDINEYTVRFYDINDNVIKKQSVNWNDPAYAPTDGQMQEEGYTFLGWDPADFSHVKEDMDIKPLYKKNDYKLTIIADHGKVDVEFNDEHIEDLEHFHIGDVLRLTVIPDEGYELNYWTTAFYNAYFSDTKASVTTFTFPAADVEMEAVFRLKTYKVTLEAEHGTIDVLPLYLDMDKIQHGTDLWLTATADETYQFVGWSDGVKTEKRELIVVSDTIVKALFEFIPDFYDPKNLKVTQTPIGNDVEIALSWDVVPQAASYQVQLEYDEQVYGPIPTLGDNSLKVNLSMVRSKITIPVAPGSYTIQWAVRSVDMMNNPLCDWVESEFVIVVEDTGTGIDNIEQPSLVGQKILRDGKLFIIVGEKMYDAAGRLVK